MEGSRDGGREKRKKSWNFDDCLLIGAPSYICTICAWTFWKCMHFEPLTLRVRIQPSCVTASPVALDSSFYIQSLHLLFYATACSLEISSSVIRETHCFRKVSFSFFSKWILILRGFLGFFKSIFPHIEII